MSSLRELYQEDSTTYTQFAELECAVIPEASRKVNKDYEHQIHFGATLQLEYTWLNKSLEAQRLEAQGNDNNEIKRQLQLASMQAVDKLLTTAKGMQQYNRVKRGFDKDHTDNNYTDLGKYGNEQSFIEIGKIMNKTLSRKENTTDYITGNNSLCCSK